MQSDEERFWSKVEKAEGCWEWNGTKRPEGYGRFWRNGRMATAHRVAYELSVGAIPSGMQLDHTCHNRGCVNPEHLRTVTNKQNQENRLGAHRNSKSGIRGVYWNAASRKWAADVRHNGTKHFLGYFTDKEDAHAAVVEARKNLFTHHREI